MISTISIILIGLAVLITNYSLVRLSTKLRYLDRDLWWQDLTIKALCEKVNEQAKQIKELKKRGGDKK